MFLWCLGFLYLINSIILCRSEFMTELDINKDYGPYDVIIYEFKGIRGPKHENLTSYETALEQRNGDFIAVINLTVHVPAVIEGISLTVYSLNQTSKKLIWKQPVVKPCKHFLFRVLFEKYLNTGSNCLVKKGPYDVITYEFKAVRGPKHANVTTYETALEQQNGDYIGVVNLTVFVPTVIEEIKILVYLVNQTSKKLIWKQPVVKPCKHFAFSALFEKYLNTSRSCLVKKGNFRIRVSFSQLFHSLIQSAIYGQLLVKFTCYAKKGNVFNTIVRSDVIRKKTKV